MILSLVFHKFLLKVVCVCRYSQNILMLREQVDDTQRQVASLGGEPQKTDPLREEQVRELQGQLETLRAKMHRMETLEKSFSETKRQLEVRSGCFFFFCCFFFCFFFSRFSVLIINKIKTASYNTLNYRAEKKTG